MREVELKVKVDKTKVLKLLEERYGKGSIVNKKDQYFVLNANDTYPVLRVRENNNRVEITTKKDKGKINGIENNFEYELYLNSSFSEAVEFFSILGYKKYFIKTKTGYQWNSDSVHLELLDVNSLGTFLELETLIPFNSSNDEIEECKKKLVYIIESIGYSENDIVSKPYREFILGT